MPNYISNIKIMYIFTALLSFKAYIPIYIIYLHDYRGMSLATIGLLEGIGWVATAISEVPTGLVSDRYGRKASLIAGCLLLAPVYIGYGLAGYFPLILVFHLIWNFSYGFFSGSDTALIYDSLKQANRTSEFVKISGIYLAITSGASAVGVLVGGWIFKYNISYPFVSGGLLILIAAAVSLFLKEPISEHDINKKPLSIIQNAKIAFQIIKQNHMLKDLVIYRSLLNIPPWCFTFFFVSTYLEEIHISATFLGIIFFLIRTGGIIGSVLSERVSKLLNEAILLFFVPFVMVFEIMCTVFFRSSMGVFGIILLSITWATVTPFYSKLINDLIPSGQRATIISFQSLMTTICLAVFIPILGGILEKYGYNFTAIVVSIGTLGLGCFIYYKEKEQRKLNGRTAS